jgi:hypothetical protein
MFCKQMINICVYTMCLRIFELLSDGSIRLWLVANIHVQGLDTSGSNHDNDDDNKYWFHIYIDIYIMIIHFSTTTWPCVPCPKKPFP